MHFWGLTIDTVSCINLVLAIGLCVDYAAHVAHTFMTKAGSRNERASATISSIGPAVFHGGFSTFLAFIFLASSDSHVFTTFFKVNNFCNFISYKIINNSFFKDFHSSCCIRAVPRTVVSTSYPFTNRSSPISNCSSCCWSGPHCWRAWTSIGEASQIRSLKCSQGRGSVY